jgi:hypothetical protein
MKQARISPCPSSGKKEIKNKQNLIARKVINK